jgi:hypothetical protein
MQRVHVDLDLEDAFKELIEPMDGDETMAVEADEDGKDIEDISVTNEDSIVGDDTLKEDSWTLPDIEVTVAEAPVVQLKIK